MSTTTGFLPPISARTRLTCRWPGSNRRRRLDDLQTNRLGAGEHDECHPWVLDERRADVFAGAGEEREHTRRHAGLVEDLDQAQRDTGRLLGGLEHHRVAGDERGSDHPGGYREREVPRRDHRTDSERLVGVRVGFAGDLSEPRAARQAECLSSVVLAEVDRLAHVGVGLGDRLPGLEDLQRRQLDPSRAQDRRRPEQDRGSLRPRSSTPRRPCGRGDVDRGVDERAIGPATPAHDAIEATRIHRDDLSVGRNRMAVDEDGCHESELIRRHRGRLR